MMGLAWAPCWVIAGLLPFRFIAGELDPEHIGGPLYAGFICGAVFSALAGVAAGRRGRGEVRPQQAAAWGAASGLFVGVLPFVVGDNGRYQNGWSVAIVATRVVAARIVANRPGEGGGFVPPAF